MQSLPRRGVLCPRLPIRVKKADCFRFGVLYHRHSLPCKNPYNEFPFRTFIRMRVTRLEVRG